MTADPENTDEDTYEDDEQKTREGLTLSAPIDDFCPNSNLGNVIIHALILEDKIAGIVIEVLNGANNDESKKGVSFEKA